MKYVDFYGNLFGCPYGHRLITCPVYKLDQLSFTEKFNWFENLTPTEKDAILDNHTECVEIRANKKVQV